VQQVIGEARAQLDRRGRVLLRKSGTEPLVRVMVESPDAGQVDALCEHIAAQVRIAMTQAL